MIPLDDISKQPDQQIWFADGSMGTRKREKVGLLGPNSAGETAEFPMTAQPPMRYDPPLSRWH